MNHFSLDAFFSLLKVEDESRRANLLCSTDSLSISVLELFLSCSLLDIVSVFSIPPKLLCTEKSKECGLFIVVNNKAFHLIFSLYYMSLNYCILTQALRSLAFNIFTICIYCFVVFILFRYMNL